MQKPPESLKDRVQNRMAQLGLNQKKLAERSKIPTSSLNGILGQGKAQKSVGHDHLYRLSKALQTTMEYLAVGGSTETPRDTLEFLLSPSELALVRGYRGSSAKERAKIDGFVAGLASSAGSRPRPRRGAKEQRDDSAPNAMTR